MKSRTLRICSKGHKYYKSSNCLTCPICEKEQKPKDGFLSKVSAPARRALEREGITTLKKLSKYSEKEILNLHGIGPTAIPKLKSEFEKVVLNFKN
ncbi:MAG: RNA polymerase alpha subunit C-terminal domain-containing protein [Ignavibacteriae bacterium]|nr:RNA polymerase alpha subunit C-terminal domain-containing protein [Ignavibacteriota bacterium]MCB0746823.1 RNA polymerase alpha subunit C-terminal domain-containing protein [Ignavibacteriota bacterium]MCB0752889.1 RNA polymerase alpha subunit C-terminal domain-containing protein [Ignavibacteriota bacterium]MCB9248657.1 hypothetical protein [Ignavibacteriales bacterium]